MENKTYVKAAAITAVAIVFGIIFLYFAVPETKVPVMLGTDEEMVGLTIGKPEDMSMCEATKDWSFDIVKKTEKGRMKVTTPMFPVTVTINCPNGGICQKTFKSCLDLPPKGGLPCDCEPDVWLVKIKDYGKEGENGKEEIR